MKSTRRFTLLIATTALVLGSIAPPALAARPTKPAKPSPSADLSLYIWDNTEDQENGSSYGAITYDSDGVSYSGEITYDLAIYNAGPSSVSAGLDVSVSGGAVKSWTWKQGTCTSPTVTTMQCDLGVLLSGASTRVYLVVKWTRESLITDVTLSGNVYGNQLDPDTSNNQHTKSTSVGVLPYSIAGVQWPSTPELIDCCWGE